MNACSTRLNLHRITGATMPRNPTAKQQEASRCNGSKGRGPLCDTSKQVAAQNSRRAGLFARTDALPHEIAEWGSRSRVWHEHYQPQTPASMHLTNECARASLLADRCADYRDAVIEDQTKIERNNWYQQQRRNVARLEKELDGDCESSYAKLISFGEGVRFVIRSFRDLIAVVQSNGFLTPEDAQFAIRLFGVTPTRENIILNVMAYVINIYNLGCTPGVPSTVIEDWLQPANRPDVLQDWEEDDLFDVDAEANRDQLVSEFEREIERLLGVEKEVIRDVDVPRVASLLKRASILTEADARRVARSHSESRATYHRAARDLWPMLAREQEQGLQEPAGDDAGDPVAGDEVAAVVTVSAPAPAEAVDPGRDQPAAFSDPVCEGGSGLADPAPGWVAELPASACGAETRGSQIEPEDSPAVSTQTIDDQGGSVDGGSSGSGRQNGVLSGAPALESRPAGAPATGEGDDPGRDEVSAVSDPVSAVSDPVSAGGPGEEGIEPSGAAPSLPGWAALVPLAACRRDDSFLNEDSEKAANGSAQVVDPQTSPADGRPSELGRTNGVPGGAPALPEPPPGPGAGRIGAHDSAARVGRSAREVIASRGMAPVPLRGVNGSENDRVTPTESSGEARTSGSGPPEGGFRLGALREGVIEPA